MMYLPISNNEGETSMFDLIILAFAGAFGLALFLSHAPREYRSVRKYRTPQQRQADTRKRLAARR
jgi:hypothetical protein